MTQPGDVRRHSHEMQATYRYLRSAIILLTLLLAVGVGLQVAADGGAVLMSVSAYYYTGARDVFVAALCAIGACLIIHRGRSDTEDVLLNLSGYLAFFVAFVPTAPTQAVYDPGASGPQVPIEQDAVAAITQNTWAALAVGLVAFVLEVVLVPQRDRHRHTRQGTVVRVVGAAGYLVLAGYFLAARDSFLSHGHTIAAVLLFAGILGVVGVNATALSRYRAECRMSRRRQWANWYTLGFVLMLLTVAVVAGPLRALVPHWIFVLEAALIVQFLAFWVTQTAERWRAPALRTDALFPG